MESGRIKDSGDEQHLRSGLREVVGKFGCNPILMPSQDILLSDIAPEMRASIERELRNYGITLPATSPLYGDGPWRVRRYRHAAWR